MSRVGKAPISIPEGIEIKIDGNKVSVKGKLGELSETVHAELSLKMEEGQIIVKVKDIGEGMSKDTLHALFDPFYTTKPSGVSLGLGLTISTNIIHEFHGSLTAMNNTGKGACFIITLPMA